MSTAIARPSTEFEYQRDFIPPDVPAPDSPIDNDWTGEVEWWLAQDPSESSVAFGYDIAGEEFFLEIDIEGDLFIRHHAWSLVGHGASLLGAERDLFDEAAALKETLGKVPYHKLDHEARRLLGFLDRIV